MHFKLSLDSERSGVRPLKPKCAGESNAACPSLSRVSEMPHSLLAGFESLWQRILPGANYRQRRVRMETVLLMRFPASRQRMAMD